MRKTAMFFVGVMVAATSSTVAQRDARVHQTPDVALKQAMTRELVDGDLNAAIARYRELAEQYRTIAPSVAARALLQIAAAYETLEDPEARTAYDTVLREFPDERDAVAVARARVGASTQRDTAPALTTSRVLPTGEAYTRISPDGRFVAKADHATGNLVLLDLTTKEMRPLTTDGSPDDPDHRFPLASAFSRDGRQIAYQWYFEIDDRSVVRVASTAPNTAPRLRTIYDNSELDFLPTDWSPDGEWIAGVIRRDDRTAQIGVLGARSGSLRVLKTVDWSRVGGMRFSADSAWLAYHRPASEGGFDRDVFLIATDGSSERTLAVSPGDDTVLEWTPDGSRLLVASDRGGSSSVWSVSPFDASRPAFELVKSDIGIISSLGPTRDGTLFYNLLPSAANIFVAAVDVASGKFTSPVTQPIQQFKGYNASPEWSPDGRFLAYASRRDVPAPINTSRPIVPILSMATGRVERELVPRLSYSLGTGRWSPDGSKFLVYGADLKGRGSLLVLDAATGEPVHIVPNDICGGFPQWAPDSTSFFCHRAPDLNKAARSEIVRVDATSGAVLRSYPAPGQNRSVSPDGRFVVHGPGLKLLTLATGESRDLADVSPPSRLGNMNATDFTPDSRHVAFYAVINGVAGMWLVSVDGGTPRRIEGAVDREIYHWRFNPKTSQVAFATDNQAGGRLELWKMENFLTTTRR